MTTFSDAFRAEILRVVRKQMKVELSGLRKTVKSQRAEITSLKLEVKTLTSQVKVAAKAIDKTSRTSANSDASAITNSPPRRGRRFKFDSQTLLAKRKYLGMSQQDMAMLLGASALSVSRWESGNVIPRTTQLERIKTVLKMGKREARTALQT